MSDHLTRLILLVAYINVPQKVGRARWERCWYAAAARSDVFGLNESLTLRQRRTYRRLARQHGWLYRGLWTGPNPIFWKPDTYQLYSSTQVRLHARGKGRLAVQFPGFNAARFLNIVVLQPKAGGPLVTLLCWHLVPNAKVAKRWRNRVRARSIVKIRRIAEHHRRLGRVVVGGLDTNIRGHMNLGHNWVWLKSGGIDKLGIALPDGIEFTDGPTTARRAAHEFDAPTDHRHGVSAGVHLTIGAAA